MKQLIRLSVLLLLLLGACKLPTPGQPAQDKSSSADKTAIPEPETQPNDIPPECAFAWARQPLPELSRQFDNALKEMEIQASGYADAYGENCITSNGEVVRFLTMETDFYITLQVENLEDKQMLGELIQQVLAVVSEFPPQDTPGPQPGYVGITFQASGEELRLWFTQLEAEAAINTGLEGEQLFDAVQSK